jgi:hypothetical protein
LERDGIVTRRIYASVPPRVEYSLIDLGRSLVKLLAGICTWAEAHIEEIQQAREMYDRLDHSSADAGDIASSVGIARNLGVYRCHRCRDSSSACLPGPPNRQNPAHSNTRVGRRLGLIENCIDN